MDSTLSRVEREQPWAPSWEAFQKMQKEPKPIITPSQQPVLRLWDHAAEPVDVMGLPVRSYGR